MSTTAATPTLAPPSSVRPYIGLRYFTEADAQFFYGRDENVVELLGKLAANRFVAVLGSSASGKSSLVRAGLLPELRSGMIPKAGPNWKVVEFKPGRDPLGELANALNIPDARQLVEEGPLGIVKAVTAAKLPEKTNVLIIADQFEEVFRFQREESAQGPERAAAAAEQCQSLVRRLLDAADQPDVSIYVLLVMRSDYLGECAQFPDLPERMSASLYLAPRLRRDQLQEAITAPVGGNIEPALVQRLINDAGTDPDQLPRLQHLLGRMWDLANGERLTMQHYTKCGGWEKGIEQHLNEVFDKLEAPQQDTTRRVFQQLSELDKGRAVRRRLELTELEKTCGAETTTVVDQFQQAGFLSVQSNVVDICHECVLRNWSKAQKWLKEELAARDFYLQLIDRQKRRSRLFWADLKEAAKLQTAGRLSEEWAVRYGSSADLNAVTHHVSVSRGKLYATFVGIFLLCLTALAAIVYTIASSKQQERNSRARELTAYAAMDENRDPSRALYLGLAAVRLNASPPPSAIQEILNTALSNGPSFAALYGHRDRVNGVAWSPDGKILASSSNDQTTRLWNAANGQLLRTIRQEEAMNSVAWSPDGKTLASAGDEEIQFLNAADGRLLRTIRLENAIGSFMALSVALSPDSKTLSTSGYTTIQLWNATDGQLLHTIRQENARVAWSSDSKTLASSSFTGGIRLWDAASGMLLQRINSDAGHRPDGPLAWSPNGSRIASGSRTNDILLWNVATRQVQSLRGHSDTLSSLAWSPDGQTLASASEDKTIRIWAVTLSDKPWRTFSTEYPVRAVAWSPRSKILASAGDDNSIRLWDLASQPPIANLESLPSQVQNSIRLFSLSKHDCQYYFQKDSCPPLQ